MELKIHIKKLIAPFIIVLSILILLHLMALTFLNDQTNTFLVKILKLVHLDEEANFPTFFSSLLFIISSALLLFIGKSKSSSEINPKYWIVLSLIFLFLSIDEIVQLHEKFSNVVHQKFQIGGILRFSWWIIYAVFIIAVSPFFMKFLAQLPKTIKRIFILAAVVFLSGSIILEIVGIYIYSTENDTKTYTFYIISSIEEILEMIGLAIFIYGLLKYVSLTSEKIIIKIESDNKV